jgi:hypothetical protein
MITTLAAMLTLGAQAAGPFPEGRLDLSGAMSAHGGPVMLPAPNSKATVLLFIMADCPIANRYAPEIGRIAREFGAKGVAFFRVYVDPETALADMTKHAKDFGYSIPALLDAKLKLVNAARASVTPEAAVVSPSGTLLYRGRIDARYVEHARVQETGFRKDLRIALNEVLAGKQVSVRMTPAVGCFIPKGAGG